MNNGKPNFVHTFAREQHGAANPRWQESYAYSNGSGGVAMVKAQAHPGKAFTGERGRHQGRSGCRSALGRQRADDPQQQGQAGQAVRALLQHHARVRGREGRCAKSASRRSSTTTRRTQHPHRCSRTARSPGSSSTPWLQKVFDANDTVKRKPVVRRPRQPRSGTQPEPLNDPERRAAWLAAKHADTPGVIHFDSLGRPVYAVSDYGGGKTAAVRSESDLTGRFSRAVRPGAAGGRQRLRRHGRHARSSATAPRRAAAGPSRTCSARWSRPGTSTAASSAPSTTSCTARSARSSRRPGRPRFSFNYVVYGDRLANARAAQPARHGASDLRPGRHGAGAGARLQGQSRSRSSAFWPRTTRTRSTGARWPAQPDVAAIQAAADPALETGEVFTASAAVRRAEPPDAVTLPDGTVIVPDLRRGQLPRVAATRRSAARATSSSS